METHSMTCQFLRVTFFLTLNSSGLLITVSTRRTEPALSYIFSQFIIRCDDASRVAAMLFSGDHITEIKLNEDGLGMLVMTRDRERFMRALGRIAIDGHKIDGVLPADENVDALYEYLIGGGQ
jgi:hypothetical protein